MSKRCPNPQVTIICGFSLFLPLFLLFGLLLVTPKLMNYLDKLADKKYQASASAPPEDRAGKAKKDEWNFI